MKDLPKILVFVDKTARPDSPCVGINDVLFWDSTLNYKKKLSTSSFPRMDIPLGKKLVYTPGYILSMIFDNLGRGVFKGKL